MRNEEYIQDMKRRDAELEYEYWELKVETAKRDKELHDKMVKYFEENLDSLVKSALGIGVVRKYGIEPEFKHVKD